MRTKISQNNLRIEKDLSQADYLIVRKDTGCVIARFFMHYFKREDVLKIKRSLNHGD